MANAYPTLLDIANANASDPVVGLIEESIAAHPELTEGAARTIPGFMYKARVRTALPTVAFRSANAGVDTTKSTYDLRLVECFMMNPVWQADKLVADADERGASAYIAEEAVGHVEAAMRTLGSQFYYGTGTGGDSVGHPGLLQQYDTTNFEVDAGGTTASTGSSVWGVRFGLQDVNWVWGQNGELALSEVLEQIMLDSNSKSFPAYVQNLAARVGLQVGRKQACARIKKLTEDSGKGLTDALLAKLYAKFPVGFKPTHWLMSRRSQRQLRDSRTATNPTGAEAPFPDSAYGVPILVTDSILDTEALTL